MTYEERMAPARKCASCPYTTLVTMMVTEEGEYEPEFGRTECCSRIVRKKVRVCKLIPCVCAEIDSCPLDTMTDDEIDEKLDEFDNIDYE